MKGTQRVDRVISKFAVLATELDRGVIEIDEEISFNTSVIESLRAKVATLGDTVTTARNVAKNLRKIIDE